MDLEHLKTEIAASIEHLDPELSQAIATSTIPAEAGDGCLVVDTVPQVVQRFLSDRVSYRTAVLEQVNSDGDTDTKAAMMGQLIGAQNGIEAIPPEWLAGLEDGHRGRRYLILLADSLLLLACRQKTTSLPQYSPESHP